MTILKQLFAVLALIVTLGPGAIMVAQSTQPAKPVDEFVPISELPPQDQLPAAPLLVIAYAIILIVLFVYLISLARRMSAIQREVQALESSVGRSRRE